MPKDHRTRSRLIEAAGIVFSEKGYDRVTTAREICDLARTNPAAVNYHFGGNEPLYVEVLRQAHRRLMNIGYLEAAVEETGAAEEKLGQFLTGLLHSLLDTSPEGWIAKVVMRELSAPTRASQEVVELQVRPTSRLFRNFMAQLMDLPVDHPAVIRGVLSTVGQCMFLFQTGTSSSSSFQSWSWVGMVLRVSHSIFGGSPSPGCEPLRTKRGRTAACSDGQPVKIKLT